MTSRHNVRNAAILLMALFSLNSCIEEGDSITQSTGYGTVIVDEDGNKIVALENSYYGTVSAYLYPLTTTSLSDYDAGTRLITGYYINWDQQTAHELEGSVDAELTISNTWSSEAIIDNSSEPTPFASDTIQAALAPFITYDSNGNSVLTTAGVMQGIASGGSNYTLQLERAMAYDSENLTDTLYLVLDEGDVDSSKDSTTEYKSFVLPQELYKDDEVTLIIRFAAKSVTGNYSIGYLGDEYEDPYFKLTYENPYYE